MGGFFGKPSENGDEGSSKDSGITCNMMLLGAPNAGKSTVFRQLKLIYRNGLTTGEKWRARTLIRVNVMKVLLKLDDSAGKIGLNLATDEAEDSVTTLKIILTDFDDADDDEGGQLNIDKYQKMYEERKDDFEFPAKEVMCLFNDPAIQTVLSQSQSADSKLNETCIQGRELAATAMPYFLAMLDKICEPDYVPTHEDCLRLRRPTTGVESINFRTLVKGVMGQRSQVSGWCKDIGGQAQEQRKWEDHAEGVHLVVFVVSMSDFDIVDEDGNNLFLSQLGLLRNIFEAKCFEQAEIAVLLNKSDLMKEKLKTLRFSDYFPDYNGKNQISSIVQYTADLCEKMFKEANPNRRGFPGTLPTCALDRKVLKKVIVQGLCSVVQSRLQIAGLLA